MIITEILENIDHRPWNLPYAKWRFYQEWNNAIFLHWPVDLKVLEKYIPKALEIDLFNGQPWISVVAFTMEKIRPRQIPSFKPISEFHEINIRTYVRKGNRSGVYFLSIEGGKRTSCKIAKGISELPYRYSRMQRRDKLFTSENKEFGDCLKIRYDIKNAVIEKDELDLWLTERYALFQDVGDSINKFEIHHIEWPIAEIYIDQLEIDYDRFHELIQGRPVRKHYSEGVQVVAWGKTIC